MMRGAPQRHAALCSQQSAGGCGAGSSPIMVCTPSHYLSFGPVSRRSRDTRASAHSSTAAAPRLAPD